MAEVLESVVLPDIKIFLKYIEGTIDIDCED